jgi:hypothetical protein
MRKKDELSLSNTCMAHAHEREMVFVLLSRDAAAPVAIRAWIAERLRLGKNVETDEQIVEALDCAATMEAEGRTWADQVLCGKTIQGFIPTTCILRKGHAEVRCSNGCGYPL